jgi:hypothetical protein
MKTKSILMTLCLLAIATTVLHGQPPGGGGAMQQGDGVWLRNAYWGEAQTFDGCNGHQPGSGMYHHHANPICLRAQLEDNVEPLRTLRTGIVYREKAAPYTHSPILGWSFDGYPIYGPYGYADPTDPASEVRRIRSSFRLREITERSSLPDWAMPFHTNVSQQLPENRRGPAISVAFPLGRYQEDFDFVAGHGDLDVYNGRFTITPEFPQGTYAYFSTIEEDGTPAFPYILGAQYYGSVTGGMDRNPPAELTTAFQGGVATNSGAPASRLLTSWSTANSQQPAQVINSFNPAADPLTTWAPDERPEGARVAAGGVTEPANADIQRIRYNEVSVWVDANGLASYTMGPWFDVLQPGGVFTAWPSRLNAVYRVPLTAQPVTGERRTGGLGPVGVWVNGVAVFNVLDGGSYSTANSNDRGGGLVSPTALHASAATGERNPLAAGSMVNATPLFGGVIATETATADGDAEWPLELGGTAITITDAAGDTHQARIGAVSPEQVTYRLPAAAATGYGSATIRTASGSIRSNIYIVANYPTLALADETGLAAAELLSTTAGGTPTSLLLYGTGLGATAEDVSAIIGGRQTEVTFTRATYAGAGLDEYIIAVPPSLAGNGRTEIVLSAGGIRTNSVYVTIR